VIGIFFMLLISLPRITSCVAHNGGEGIPIIHGGVEE